MTFAAPQDLLDVDEPPLLHLVVSARDRPPPNTVAARSVFEVGDRAMRSGIPHRAAAAAAGDRRSFTACHREDGRTLCVGLQYPGDRWTNERQEQELARRAKQRPPKPTKRARTHGKRLLSLIGNDIFE